MQITRENYFSLDSNIQYLSVSQFKSFIPAYGGCEAAALAVLHGLYEPPEKTAFIEGKYVHSWNSNELDLFKEQHPEIFNSRTGEMKANFKHCNSIIEVLENDPLVMKALRGRKEVIFTAKLFGADWKIMIDSYQPETGIFTDLKVLKGINEKYWNDLAQCYENFIDHYGYNVQMAVYAEIERLATGRDKWLIPHMVVVTKQDPPDHEIIYFDYEAIEQGLAIVSNHIERVKAVKSGQVEPMRCERCSYCRASKKITRIKHYSEFSLY